jgi:WhiB family redox-sensing transcriptional regulator
MEDWTDHAACRGERTAVFYPEHGQTHRHAKRICAGCPVRQICLGVALANGEAFGVWGGLNELERRQLRSANTLQPARPDVKGRTRPRKPFEHGLPGTSGYQRHLREHTAPCRPCRSAAAAARKSYRKGGE